mgnify:FL=1
MNINVNIERLILDGLHIQPGQGDLVKAAIEAELSRLLTNGGIADSLQSGGAFPSVHTNSIQVTELSNPTQLGGQIAQAVYREIGT